MPNTVPAIEVMGDFANDGTLEDLKAAGFLDLGPEMQLRISQGVNWNRDGYFEPVQSDLTLPMRNRGNLTPTYASATYYGQPMTAAPLRIRATHDSITYDVWKGRLKRRSWGFRPGRRGRVTVNARDLLGIVRNRSVSVEANASYDIDGAMSALMLATPGVVSGDLDLTDSARAVELFWLDNANVGQALRDLAISDPSAWVWTKPDGVLAFRPLSSLLGTSLGSNANWGGYDTNGIINPIEAWIEDDDDDLLTRVEVTPMRYNLGSGGTVVYDAAIGKFAGVNKIPAIELAAGEVQGPTWLTPNQQGIQSVSGLPTSLPYIDYTANSAADGSGSDMTGNITVHFTASGYGGAYYTLSNSAGSTAYITKLIIRAIAVLDQQGGVTDNIAKGAGTFSNDSSAGAVSWISASDAGALDGNDAAVTLTAGQRSRYLKGLSWGISLPNGATVNGIVARVYGMSTVAGNTLIGKLVKAGTIQTPTVTANAELPTSDGNNYLGGATDTWGVTLTAADLADANFGVVFYVDNAAAGTIRVDHVELTIHYSIANGISTTHETYVAELPLPGIPGGRTSKLRMPWCSDPNGARDYGQQALAICRHQPGIVRMRFKFTDDAITKAILGNPPSSVIRYKMPTAHGQYGDNLDDYYRVLRRDLYIQAGALTKAEVWLMPTYNFRNPAKIHWDGFDRADTVTGVGTTPTGKTYLEDAADFRILSGKAVLVATGGSDRDIGFDVGDDDLVVRCTLAVARGTGSSARGFIKYRCNSTAGNSTQWTLKVEHDTLSYKWELFQPGTGAGGGATIAGATGGDPVEVEVRCYKGRHRVYINRALRLDLRDETANGGSGNTHIFLSGYRANSNGSVTFDDLYAQALEA